MFSIIKTIFKGIKFAISYIFITRRDNSPSVLLFAKANLELKALKKINLLGKSVNTFSSKRNGKNSQASRFMHDLTKLSIIDSRVILSWHFLLCSEIRISFNYRSLFSYILQPFSFKNALHFLQKPISFSVVFFEFASVIIQVLSGQ